MGCQYQAGLQRASGGAIELPLSWVPRGSGRPEETDAGDRGDADALWLSPYPCVAPAGGLGCEREAERGLLRGVVFE